MKKLFFALAVALTSFTGVQAQSKIAHINSQTLLDTMPSRKAAIAEINELERRGSEELQLMSDNFQKEYYAYEARKATQGPDMNAYDEKRLSKMQNDIQSRQMEIEEMLQIKSEKLNTEILASVKQAVDIVAKKKGLNYVIDESSTLFASGTNITNDVIPELLRIDAEKQKAKTATGGTVTAPKTN